MPNTSFLHDSKLGPYYDDGKVCGDVEWTPETGGFAIHTWSSHEKGKGHTLEALRKIRDELGATHIHVVGAGYMEDGIPSESLRYWLHLARQGWVQSIEDDEGLNVPFEKTSSLQDRPVSESLEPK
jgi:hypothetical protein